MEVRGVDGGWKSALFVLIGVGLIGYGGYSLMEQNSAVKNAEPVNATIQSTGVEEESARRGVKFRPTAEFTYSFQGEEYTGGKVYPGPMTQKFRTQREAEEEIDYARGNTVQAFVNPESPGDAFLKKDKSASPIMMLVIGVLISGVAAYSLVKP